MKATIVNQNEDGTFSIQGTEHETLTREALRKLQALQGGKWLVFCNYGVKPEPGVKVVSFNAAM